MSGSLFSIQDGNKQLASGALKSCSPNLLRAKVRRIEYDTNRRTYIVHSEPFGKPRTGGRKHPKETEDDRLESEKYENSQSQETNQRIESENARVKSEDDENFRSESEDTENTSGKTGKINADKSVDSELSNSDTQSDDSEYESANENTDFGSDGKASANQNAALERREYDYVILATPLSLSGIRFSNMAAFGDLEAQKYHVTVTTLVQGEGLG